MVLEDLESIFILLVSNTKMSVKNMFYMLPTHFIDTGER